MALHLGIEIGIERVVAAVDRDGTPSVVRLGQDPTIPAVAHVAEDGSVEVGDAALARAGTDEAGLVRELAGRLGDPEAFVVNGRAVDAEVLVAHLLADVVATVIARQGRQPDTITLVYPDTPAQPADLLHRHDHADQAAALVAAAARAQLGPVRTISDSEARGVLRQRRLAAGDPAHAGAVGAAVSGSMAGMTTDGSGPVRPGVGPILTREDIEGPAPAPPRRELPPLVSAGPASVFDEPTRVDSASVRPPIRLDGPPPRDPAFDRALGLDNDDDEPQGRWLWAAVATVAVVVLVLALVLVLTRGDEDTGVAETTTTLVNTTTTAPAPTTAAVTTTTGATTTSSTTTTTTSTTTTTLAPGPTVGDVAVADFGLELRPGKPTNDDVVFGTDDDDAFLLVRGLLGPPDDDSGYESDPDCDGDAVRRVRWGDLELVFVQQGEDDAPDMTRTFEQWFFSQPGGTPNGVLTPERVGIGATVTRLDDTYGARFELEAHPSGRGTGLIIGEDDRQITLVLTGILPEDQVIRMWSGLACEREL